MKIKNRVISFTVGGSGGCCSHEDTEFRFLQSGKKFILVGAETTAWSATNLEYAYESRQSINFRSEKVVYSMRTGNPRDNERVIDRNQKNQYTEVKLPFKSLITWEIANFQADNYFKSLERIPNLCGWIDGKKRKFVSCKDI